MTSQNKQFSQIVLRSDIPTKISKKIEIRQGVVFPERCEPEWTKSDLSHTHPHTHAHTHTNLRSDNEVRSQKKWEKQHIKTFEKLNISQVELIHPSQNEWMSPISLFDKIRMEMKWDHALTSPPWETSGRNRPSSLLLLNPVWLLHLLVGVVSSGCSSFGRAASGGALAP